jgi:hypothetical protein
VLRRSLSGTRTCVGSARHIRFPEPLSPHLSSHIVPAERDCCDPYLGAIPIGAESAALGPGGPQVRHLLFRRRPPAFEVALIPLAGQTTPPCGRRRPPTPERVWPPALFRGGQLSSSHHFTRVILTPGASHTFFDINPRKYSHRLTHANFSLQVRFLPRPACRTTKKKSIRFLDFFRSVFVRFSFRFHFQVYTYI